MRRRRRTQRGECRQTHEQPLHAAQGTRRSSEKYEDSQRRKRVSARSVNVFSGCINEDRSRLHVFDHVRRAFSVSAEAKLRAIRIFVQVSGEMDDGVVISDRPDIVFTQYVVAGTTREIISIKKVPDVCAEITAAAGNEDFHKLNLVSKRKTESFRLSFVESAREPTLK